MKLPRFIRRQTERRESGKGWLVRIAVRLSGGDVQRLGAEAEEVADALAARVVDAARPGDDRSLVARNQYLLVIRLGRRSGDASDPIPVVRRLLNGLAKPVDSSIGPIFPRFNAAFSTTPCAADDAAARNALADALEQANSAGSGVAIALNLRNGDREMMTLDTPETQTVSVLKRAIDANQVVMHYQPVVRLSDGRVTSFEALMRVIDENDEAGLLSPSKFIRVAEETGLIHELGRIALASAAAQMKGWRAAHGDAAPNRIAVNVSPPQLANADFVLEARRAFAEVGLKALTIELTETAQISEMPQAVAALAALRADGAWIALDDFGVEYSNLAYLRDLAVDMVKIDRSFLDSAESSARAVTILTKIVELAHLLDAKVVAEGVSSAAQSAALDDLGVDFGQGIHFGLGMVPEEAANLIKAQADPPPAESSSGEMPNLDNA